MPVSRGMGLSLARRCGKCVGKEGFLTSYGNTLCCLELAALFCICFGVVDFLYYPKKVRVL